MALKRLFLVMFIIVNIIIMNECMCIAVCQWVSSKRATTTDNRRADDNSSHHMATSVIYKLTDCFRLQ